MNSSRLSVFCDRALEVGWLLGVTITPIFFNVYSSRVFEPDKLTTLRALATVMAVLWIVRWLDGKLHHEVRETFSWRTPMVLPALAVMGVYLISSAFSLVPYTSLLGSYQRLQGTYSLFGYLVIFFSVLHGLRTREQLSRLLTVLILNSLPVSLYGIVQHRGADPLPWAGDVQSRVASNMGNAIFVAAYLIMIVPLTIARIVESFRDILGRKESRIGDVMRAAGYVFILAVQLVTIWYSQSRGPWLGLVAAAFLFPYLALILLQRQALNEGMAGNTLSDLLRGIGFGLAVLFVPGVFLMIAYLLFPGFWIYLGGIAAAVIFGIAWLYCVVERKGWRWLWIGWGTVGLTVALALLAINVPGPLHERVLDDPTLGRLARITELESGTGKVRTLIWQGAMELITPHAPLVYPDGHTDPFNAIRLLVGYGPESMYVSYNNFYPPELGHYESRTASPDRSHNETLDSVAVTGLLGLAAYLFVFISVFYWGFRWLGLLQTPQQFIIYLALDVFFALLLTSIGWKVAGLYLFAVGIPLGILIGTVVYVTVAGLWRAHLSDSAEEAAIRNPWDDASTSTMLSSHPHALLIVAILSAVLGHLVEINFGIAIASTRTTFWAFAALLVVLGLNWVRGEGSVPVMPRPAPMAASEESGSEARRRRRNREGAASTSAAVETGGRPEAWWAAALALSLVAVFLLGTLSFDFINNPQRLDSAGRVFWNSLTVRMALDPTSQSMVPTQSPGALLIFGFTWLLFGVVGLSELEREGLFDEERGSRWVGSLLIYSAVSLVGWLFFGMILAGFQAELTRMTITQAVDLTDLARQFVNIAEFLSGVLAWYYFFMFSILIVTALVLVLGEKSPLPRGWGNAYSWLVLGVALPVAAFVILYGCYNLIRADIIFKQGESFSNSGDPTQKQIAVAHYEQALEYAPKEDYYYLFRGKAYLETGQVVTDTVQREALMSKTEEVLQQARQINPLNTDHSANLGRFYRSWAAQTADATLKAQLLENAEQNYKIALQLSPNNAILWNELAILYIFDFGDSVRYQETISQSLQLDPEFDQTWMLMGDVSATSNVTEAVSDYKKALEISGGSCPVRRVLGNYQAQLGQWNEAVATLITATQECAGLAEEWDTHRVLAIVYYNMGQTELAVLEARRALETAPEEQKPMLEDLLNQLQLPPMPVESTPAP